MWYILQIYNLRVYTKNGNSLYVYKETLRFWSTAFVLRAGPRAVRQHPLQPRRAQAVHTAQPRAPAHTEYAVFL